MYKSFLVLFFKKEQNFFLKKEAKTFVNCSVFDDVVGSGAACRGYRYRPQEFFRRPPFGRQPAPISMNSA
jgi:hypothetical protein